VSGGELGFHQPKHGEYRHFIYKGDTLVVDGITSSRLNVYGGFSHHSSPMFEPKDDWVQASGYAPPDDDVAYSGDYWHHEGGSDDPNEHLWLCQQEITTDTVSEHWWKWITIKDPPQCCLDRMSTMERQSLIGANFPEGSGASTEAVGV